VGQVESVRSAQVTGLEQTVRDLKQWDADALKIMNKEIYQTMKKIQVDARQLMPSSTPLSKWGMEPKEGDKWGRLQFTPRSARMGLKTKIERQRRKGTWTSRAYLMINADPAGAIYETAGRKNPGGKSPQGAAFINAIKADSNITVRGKQGRVAYKAVQDREPYTMNEMRDAIGRGVAALNRKLAR
jgi:hypothetical protein